MKAILVLTLSFLITAAVFAQQQGGPTNTNKNLRFSLQNATKIPLKEIEVKLPDTTLYFSGLKPMNKTAWVNITSAFRYAYIKFMDRHDSTYIYQPIDYVGEPLYTSGCMTFIIRSVDTNTKYWDLGYSLKCPEKPTRK